MGKCNWTISKAQEWVKEHKSLDISKIEKEIKKLECERQREILRGYNLAGRIINRNCKE